MRLILLVLAIAFAMAVAGPARAQGTSGTLAGQVSSGKTPLAGVQVQVFRPGETTPVASATTGADGKYRISPLPQTVYRVEFSRQGFDTIIRTGIVVLSTTIEIQDVVMERSEAATSGNPQPAASASPGLRQGEVGVRIETSFGAIDIAVDTTHAPITAANFLKYVDAGLYDGGRFNRVTRPDNYTPAPPNRPAMEIIQGGIDPSKKSKAFPPIALERTSVTGLKHVRGTVSMARGTPDSATSEFFILLDDQPSLDFGGMRFDDGQGGAAFGRVLTGMDVVKKIQQQPVNGQNLNPPVPINKVARIRF